MLPRSSISRAMLSATVVATLCACSSANVPVGGAPASHGSSSIRDSQSLIAQTAPKGLIYVADYTNSAVHIYPLAGKNQQEIGLIKNVQVVEFLNVDRFHNLYVVEFSAGKVLVFPRGARRPSLTLDVQPNGAFPNAVAISHSGVVAVGQFGTTGIEFFKKGATTPFKTVAPPAGFGSPGFCAFDHDGNLYVIGSAASHASHIGEIVGGSNGSSITDLGENTGITNAKGIQIDKQGNIAVLGDSGTLNLYAAGSNTLLSTAQLLDPPNGGPNPNGGFSLKASGKQLYVASAVLNQQNLGLALEYAYPAGGGIRNTITVQIPPGGGGQTSVTGVAIDPPEQP